MTKKPQYYKLTGNQILDEFDKLIRKLYRKEGVEFFTSLENEPINRAKKAYVYYILGLHFCTIAEKKKGKYQPHALADSGGDLNQKWKILFADPKKEENND